MFRLISLLTIFSFSSQHLWCRLPVEEWQVDLVPMIRQAPFIIRGEVQSATLFKVNRGRGYAPTIEIRLLPDRIYRGDQRPEFLMRYRQGPSHFPGHDCIDMRVGSNWLIFAKEQWNTKGKASYNNKKVSQ